MRLDDKGRIIAYGKVRGQAAAIRKTLDTMQEHAENGADYAGKCYICHSNCLPAAERLAGRATGTIPKAQGRGNQALRYRDDHRRPLRPGDACRLLLRRPASTVHR